MNFVRECQLLGQNERFKAIMFFFLLSLFFSSSIYAQQAGQDEINPQTTSSGGEIQQGEFGTMFSTVGEPLASDSVFLDVDGGEATWTGFWQVMPTDTTLGIYEEWAAGGIGASGITSAAPNPFSDEILLYVRLETPGNVKLSVYDMLGREAQVLIDGHREAGTSRVRWQPEEIEAGTYVLQLEVEGVQYPTTTIQYVQ